MHTRRIRTSQTPLSRESSALTTRLQPQHMLLKGNGYSVQEAVCHVMPELCLLVNNVLPCIPAVKFAIVVTYQRYRRLENYQKTE